MTVDDRLELFRAGLTLSDEIAQGQRLELLPPPAVRARATPALRREQLKAADRAPLGGEWTAETGCLCPNHEQPCHRKRRPHRRQCSACIDYCL